MKLCIKKFDRILAERCFSLAELSQISGVGKKTLGKVRASNDVRPVTIGKIAKALEVDVVELIED